MAYTSAWNTVVYCPRPKLRFRPVPTSALAGGEWSASRPGRFIPGEWDPDTHWIGDWVNPRAGLDDLEKRKFLTLLGLELRTLGRPIRIQWYYEQILKKYGMILWVGFNCLMTGTGGAILCVNMVINFWVAHQVGNFLNNWATLSFSTTDSVPWSYPKLRKDPMDAMRF
jgi:hypothetical protein